MEEKKRNAKGEGTFIQNKNGTITHKLNVGRRWDGHPKVLTVTCESGMYQGDEEKSC